MPSIENVTRGNCPPGLKRNSLGKLDNRSDEEITTWLQTRHPVTSDKNVWAFWDSGFANMVPWTQRCIISWVRRLGPEWTVHVVDHKRGSETNVCHYVEESFFPEAFNEYRMDGPNAGAHSADLVRLPLLWKYGGVWMDAATYLFRSLDDICWREIEDPDSPYEVSGFLAPSHTERGCILNGFIAAKRGNAFIKRWLDTFLALWGSATNVTDFHKHPLINHLPLATAGKPDFGDNLSEITDGQMTDYVAHLMAFERTRKLIDHSDPSSPFNGPEYLTTKFYLIDAAAEYLWLHIATRWDGAYQHEVFSTLRSGDAAIRDDRWHKADEIVSHLLTSTTAMKLIHGGGIFTNTLASIWDKEEHKEDDIAKDTFSRYLLYGCVNFDQTRKLTPVRLELTTEEVLRIGVSEAEPEAVAVEA